MKLAISNLGIFPTGLADVCPNIHQLAVMSNVQKINYWASKTMSRRLAERPLLRLLLSAVLQLYHVSAHSSKFQSQFWYWKRLNLAFFVKYEFVDIPISFRNKFEHSNQRLESKVIGFLPKYIKFHHNQFLSSPFH